MEATREVRDLVRRLGAGETASFTPAEREAARLISGHVGVRKEASSMIVAWYPWDGSGGAGDELAERLAVEGGVPPEELHMTIAWLGDAAGQDAELVSAIVKIWSNGMWGSYRGRIGGVGRFVGDGDTDVVVGLVDASWAGWARESLLCALAEGGVYAPEGGHGFIPHVTLAYVPAGEPTPVELSETVPFEASTVSVSVGRAGGPAVRRTFEFRSEEEAAEAEGAPVWREAAEKAGRVLSGRSLKLVADAADALRELVESARRKGEEDEEDDDGVEDGAYKGLLDYAVQKQVEEERYTFGPLYAPDRADAHGEWTDADTLQRALWGYVRESSKQGRRINLQHDDGGGATIAEWVEACAWPYETTIKVAVPGEGERELVMPAGTVYLGVVWDEDSWPLVKSGRLSGLSLGGRTYRAQVDVDLPAMGDGSSRRGGA